MKPRNLNDILSIEIVVNIFQYLYIDEIFEFFNDSLDYLPLILAKYKVPLHIRKINRNFQKKIFMNIDPQYVRSIRIANMNEISPIDFTTFSQAQRFVLKNVSGKNWPKAFPTQIKHLTLHVRSRDRHEVLLNALTVKNLKTLEFRSNFLHFRESNNVLRKASTVEHLSFYSQRCLIDYRFLIMNVPKLQTLKGDLTYYPQRFSTGDGRFRHLETVDLFCKFSDLPFFVSILANFAKNCLKRVRIVNTESSLSTCHAVILTSCFFLTLKQF